LEERDVGAELTEEGAAVVPRSIFLAPRANKNGFGVKEAVEWGGVEKNSRGKNNGGKGKRSRAMTFKLNERESEAYEGRLDRTGVCGGGIGGVIDMGSVR
jgi:hypothetical protein